MFHNSKTKGHGSIRKNKIYGTIGVLTLGTIAILSAHQGVAADEVKATKPTTPAPVAEASDTSLAAQSKAAATEAASSSTAKTVKETTPAASTTTAPAGSTSTTDNTTASAATKTETPAETEKQASTPAAPVTGTTVSPTVAASASDTISVAHTAPATQTGVTESKVTVESQKLKDAVSEAKGYNIDVKQNPTENIGTANNQVESDAKKILLTLLKRHKRLVSRLE